MAKQLNIYGTRRIGHREKHYVKKEGRNRYFTVRRDAKGHFRYKKQWSSKEPIKVFTEIKPLKLPYTTGKEALEAIRKATREWEWTTEMKVKS